jgi:hypothetical protein
MGTPTYWPTDSNKTPDLLDFFVITRISSEYIEVETSYDPSLDHSPVIATVCSYAIHITPRSKLHNQKDKLGRIQDEPSRRNKSKCETQEHNGN